MILVTCTNHLLSYIFRHLYSHTYNFTVWTIHHFELYIFIVDSFIIFPNMTLDIMRRGVHLYVQLPISYITLASVGNGFTNPTITMLLCSLAWRHCVLNGGTQRRALPRHIILSIYYIIKSNQLHAVYRTQHGRQREPSVKHCFSLSAEFRGIAS